MSIQLLSINAKTAPSAVRGYFAFDEEQRKNIRSRLIEQESVSEAVLLSTCNRTEIYCSGEDDTKNLKLMQKILLEAAGCAAMPEITDYLMRFQGRRAVHHLFLVTAGLDSVVLGEDQILGQVKQAYFEAERQHCCKTYFHSLFRMAITASKRIKTDTPMSKTSVSTASLALKAAAEGLGTLEGKNLLIIGASGKIGEIVLKDALDIDGINIFATVRKELPHFLHSKEQCCTLIPYDERYKYLDKMDVIISATSSPHYTITAKHFKENCITPKKRVLFDLAVPLDIESSIGSMEDTLYYSMEDMEKIAQYNNMQKKKYVSEAEEIILKYEEECLKNIVLSANQARLNEIRDKLSQTDTESADKVFDKIIYGIKKESDFAEFDKFIKTLENIF
jgi:glutamyl-tRNA reductase